VLPAAKTSGLAQSATGRPLFPEDLDVEAETLANLRILVKTFMESLWRTFYLIVRTRAGR